MAAVFLAVALRALLAIALASGSALVFNRAVSKNARPGALLAFVLGPLVEEAAKTGFALAVAAPLVVVHIGFGAAEAAYDAAGRRASGIAAGAMSLVSHGVFGVVTQQVLTITRQPLAAVLAAAVLHAVWNLVIVALAEVGHRS